MARAGGASDRGLRNLGLTRRGTPDREPMTGTVRSEFADRRDKPRRGSTEPRDRVLREAGLIVYRRIVAGVSLVLFGVVALVAVIVTDLHDRSLPQALGAKAAVTLDFSRSSLSDEGAFAELARLSDELDLGLVKVAPDLAGNRSGQVFVTLGSAGDLPSSVVRFGGQPDAQVETNAAVEHSFASGDYLVTGDHADRGSFETWLGTHHIDGRWADDGVAATLMLIVRETSFATALLTAVVLTGTLALFWLSVRARGRALRVLAGISAWRIQVEDLGGFSLATLTGAVACDAIAVAIIGLDQGWVFVPYYLQVLAVFGAIILGLTLMAALIMSAASWPTAEMLAARRPAAASLRGTSTVLKAGVFTLVVAAVAPAASAYTQATQAADQQATRSPTAGMICTKPFSPNADGNVRATSPAREYQVACWSAACVAWVYAEAAGATAATTSVKTPALRTVDVPRRLAASAYTQATQ